MRRLLFTALLLFMVAALGGWPLGADGASAPADVADASTAASAVSVVDADDGISGSATSSSKPCLVRADCAGGGLLVGPPLLLVVALPVLAALVLLSLGRATSSVAALHPALLVARLDRPPQLSS